ncbi:hypothetical protein BAUCODRAFT_38864 [Baudoinia panamericana UAMH 10762]|uniref:ATP-dependent RNA helicase n=1 Tax=Baudoinia panamericana (strain UAMH 10762) TaxID=717646 RepID=M2MK77_BAUPA|nr:uncharacterized protein BAUCODRAFT_38864 [Baudoinia panamericana UAMH 10762]EMC91733.1 hypothetical protein BAUCODRAFT_38864 [Baudoinia panamericana UAMH 10762]
MADDGLLVNFDIPTDAFTINHTTFKGGHWKDRLTAKKAAAYGRQKAAGIVNFQASDRGESDLRPAKRQKQSEGNHVASNSLKREVISSLFTYNPVSSTKPVEKPSNGEEVPIEPSNAPEADVLSSFTGLGLSTTLASHLQRKLNIKAPTAIQRKAIQQLCADDTDAFLQAETGSGKTLAYLLPIVNRIMQISKQMKAAGQNFTRESGLFAIILAPTRELSKQISTVLESLLSCCPWVITSTVIGGEKKKSEKARLRKGLNILVATPGRLADHVNSTDVLDLGKVRWLVLDEGDRLMELGFEKDLQRIIGALNMRARKALEPPIAGLPEKRTTVLCSATLKADVEQLQSIALKQPVSIAVGADEAAGNTDVASQVQAFSAPAQLRQGYAIVPAKQRLVTLVALLKQTFKRKGSVMKSIVFIDAADSVDFHFEVLTRGASQPTLSENVANPAVNTKGSEFRNTKPSIPQGQTIAESHTEGRGTFSGKDNEVRVFRLHGSLHQATRTSTLKAFSDCAQPAVLMATDVFSRGLDVPNIDLVIEYDPPASKDDHLHRIGRTARAGKDGRAMVFLTPGCEEGYINILKEGRPRTLTRHEADELLKKGFSPATGIVSAKSWAEAATEWQLDVERWALEHPKHLEQARRAYQSHVRAYATHVSAERGIFDMQQLHLGHLAKAFALRDKPANIGVPGQRPGKSTTKARPRAASATVKRSRTDDDADTGAAVDEADAKRKMREKMRAMGGVSEFNLG